MSRRPSSETVFAALPLAVVSGSSRTGSRAREDAFGNFAKFLEGDERPLGDASLLHDAQHFAHSFIARTRDTELLQRVGDRRLATLLSQDHVAGTAGERRVRAEHGKRLLHHEVDADAGFTREVLRAE